MLLGSSGPACGPRHINTRSKIVAHFWAGTGDSMGSHMNLNSRKPSMHAAASPHVCLCLAAARFSTTRPRTATLSLLTPFSPQTWPLPIPPYFRLVDVHLFFFYLLLCREVLSLFKPVQAPKRTEGLSQKRQKLKRLVKTVKIVFSRRSVACAPVATRWAHDSQHQEEE